jgi:hypothetical protein
MHKIPLAGTAPALLTIACGLLVTAAEAQPVANLPLTCSSADAIGQPQDNCNGDWAYRLPNTDQLIVVKGPSSAPVWIRASSLTNSDTVNVCTLPVEPGTYSNCRDAAGVRRFAFVPKSQVFPSPPTISGARILDLSTTPVEITEPGVYVLDRDWFALSPHERSAIVIEADDVTLDLQGFELSVVYSGVVSRGQNVTIRNGRIIAAQRDEQGPAIFTYGSRSLIESVRASGGKGPVISVSGIGSALTNSTVVSQGGSLALLVHAYDDTIVRGNQIIGGLTSMRVNSRATIVDNVVTCGLTCIDVEGDNNTVSGNKLIGRGILIRADHNHVFGNVLGCSSRTAIAVEGLGNTIRDNLVPSCTGLGTGIQEAGILFTRDGNFYGDNIVWAALPFAVGATVQTDLGGNVGFSN